MACRQSVGAFIAQTNHNSVLTPQACDISYDLTRFSTVASHES